MPRLVIATPVRGHPDSASVTLRYHQEMHRIARDPLVDSLDSRLFLPNDIVRARSRCVRMFLETDATHLLFWDADNAPRNAAQVIRLMLEVNRDVVGCPYPKKHTDWDQLAERVRIAISEQRYPTAEQLEAWSQEWVLRTKGVNSENGVAEVDGLGFGFIMLSRACCEKMTEEHPELDFADKGLRTNAMFMPMILADGNLLSEDYAFCERWRRLGGKVHMLCVAVDHAGGALYRGHMAGMFDDDELAPEMAVIG